MNVCVCANLSIDNQTGGTDRILNLARNVSLYGADVYVVGRSRLKSPFLLQDTSEYYFFKNGEMKNLSYPFYIRFFFPIVLRFSQEIADRLIRLFTLSLSSDVGLSYALDPYLFVKLLYVCKKEKIRILQFEFPTPSISAFIVKKLIPIPLVYDAHNVETERIRGLKNTSGFYLAIEKLLESFSCRIADKIFVVSKADKSQLLSWGVQGNKIEIIPNSVEVSRFSSIPVSDIRVQYGLEGKIILLFHGPMDYPPNREAADILISRLMPIISKLRPQAHLFLVGKNPPKIARPNVTVTGFVHNLPDYINAADITLVPLLKGGGTRIKILEYMAAGKAIVSTEKGAEGLDLQSGKDILMTKYPDGDFLNSIIQLIDDDSLRDNIGVNARKKAILKYSWKETGKKALGEYLKLGSVNGC